MSHSKRNTSLAFFTSYERGLLKSTWGSQATRLTRDSFLPFSACRLCMLPSRQPVACASSGHFFCRECAVSNMLAQQKEIRRVELEEEKKRAEEAEEGERKEQEAANRAIEEFEKVQMGLNVKLGGIGAGKGRKVVGREHGKITIEETVDEGDAERKGAQVPPTGSRKRKFELDEDELLRIANDERSRAKAAIEHERALAAKTQLPSFWVSSLTPSTPPPRKRSRLLQDLLLRRRSHPVCPASSKEARHPFSLKTLVAVHFAEEKDTATGERARVCPSCKKGLGGGVKVILTKPCGHVICKPCVEQFMLEPGNTSDGAPAGLPTKEAQKVLCYVCETDLSTPPVEPKKPEKKFLKRRVTLPPDDGDVAVKEPVNGTESIPPSTTKSKTDDKDRTNPKAEATDKQNDRTTTSEETQQRAQHANKKDGSDERDKPKHDAVPAKASDDDSDRRRHEGCFAGVYGLVDVDMQASGTGFAGAGKNMVAREGVAFQC